MRNFNPRSPRGERRLIDMVVYDCKEISIHAPREGSDNITAIHNFLEWNFNPRSPRGERHEGIDGVKKKTHFNPRSPRGERLGGGTTISVAVNISIHAPREGSDGCRMFTHLSLTRFQSTLPARGATLASESIEMSLPISIHAPREGSDGDVLIIPEI